mgnify:CR=1 FL=1
MKRIFVFKCGGGDAIKNAESIRRLLSILKEYVGVKIILIVSAFQGMTNLLEHVVNTYLVNTEDAERLLMYIHEEHITHAKKLMLSAKTLNALDALFMRKKRKIRELLTQNFSYPQLYSEVVSMGEKYSTLIVSSFFAEHESVIHISAETLIYTEGSLEGAKISETKTFSTIQNFKNQFLNCTARFAVTEGFIGSSNDNHSVVTTLGREGSDLTASVVVTMAHGYQIGYFKKFAYHTADPDDPKKKSTAEYLPVVSFARLENDITNPEGRKTILHEMSLHFLKKDYGAQTPPIIKIIQFSDTSKQTLVVR